MPPPLRIGGSHPLPSHLLLNTIKIGRVRPSGLFFKQRQMKSKQKNILDAEGFPPLLYIFKTRARPFKAWTTLELLFNAVSSIAAVSSETGTPFPLDDAFVH